MSLPALVPDGHLHCIVVAEPPRPSLVLQGHAVPHGDEPAAAGPQVLQAALQHRVRVRVRSQLLQAAQGLLKARSSMPIIMMPAALCP